MSLSRKFFAPVGMQALCLAAGFALSAAAIAPVAAQSARGQSADTSDVGPTMRLNLGTGKSVIVNLPRDAAEIFVANPRIANAVVRSPRHLYVIAMTGGQTTIFAMDKSGAQIARVEVLVGRDIGELDRILKTAIPRSEIVLRTVNDTIILTGSVENAGDAQKAMDIAAGFTGMDGGGTTGVAGAAGGGAAAPAGGANGSVGQTRRQVINSLTIRGRDQVMLKVSVIEVQRQIVKQLGLESTKLSGKWGSFTQDNPFDVNGTLSSTALNMLGRIGGTSVDATVRAFERNGVARILAEPTVTAISGESAKFLAGGEIPYVVRSCDSSGVCQQNVGYKPVGISLNFTPVVMSEGRILLRLATEVTEIDPSISVQGNPGFRTRKNETSVELPSGGSIASAGLIQTKGRQALTGTPGVMNLPILGSLFRSRDYQREETELMIIVTPYIAKPVAPSELARPTDGLQDATDPQAWLLGRVNKIYSTTSNPHLVRTFRGKVGFIND